ncbi:MAG TPA: TIGR03790 family protein, partial [Pirellulales bacterium]
MLLVVNQRSWASLSVANHYISLRQVPPENVLYLDWSGSMQGTDIDTFRRQVLRPILSAIERNALDDHIDYVVYSSDFPLSVDGHGEMQGLTLPNYLSPVGSLTGMTYLWPLIWARRPDWVALNSNHYVRPEHALPGVPTTQAFRSWYGWASDGALLEAGGQHYMLSAALAVTSGRGNSLAEVVDYLTRSAAADGTSPKGTIYFDDTSDIRSKCRQPRFAAAVEQLAQLGVRGEIIPEAIPRARSDVQGVMAGVADFSWPKSLSRILPGAICEHLTSTGGMLIDGAPQTPLTEWLRYGAAGSSGAVVEPYLIEAKFPLPQMHVHYARGSSLAEAYYQAVAAPYQLLIVGDPLCQPWARRPRITITGLKAGETVSGKLSLQAAVTPATANRVQWFLDGHRMAISSPIDRIALDSATLADGYHELRAVAIDDTEVETQGRAILPFVVDAQHRPVELTALTRTPRWDQALKLSCRATGADRILICQQTRVLAQVAGEQASLEIAPQALGLGPVRLEALATYPGQQQPGRSVPLELNIGAGEFWPAVSLPAQSVLVPGFDLVVGDG